MEKMIDVLENVKENTETSIFCGGKSCSYSDVFQRAQNQKELILEFGKSKTVIMYMENSIEFISTFFSIHMARKVPIMLSVMENEKTVKNAIHMTQSTLIVTDTKNRECVFKALEQVEINCYVLNVDVMKISNGGGKNVQVAQINEPLDDVAVIIKTSGTTNEEKYVMLTHDGIIQNMKAHIKSINLDKHERTLIVLPMCFGYCFSSQLIAHIYLGAQIVIYNYIFTPQEFVMSIRKYSITNTTIVPSMLYILNKYVKKNDKRLNALKKILFGGMPCDGKTLNDLNQKLKETTLIQTYGQTEHSPRISTKIYNKDIIRDLSNVGKILEGVILRIDDTTGEICVKSRCIMKGYYNQEKSTNDVIVDGWLHTGDKGYLDESCNLHIQGRIKNIIIRNGVNISPELIEQVIRNVGGVQDVLVMCESDKVTGEIIVAKILLRSGVNQEYVKSKIRKHCKENLASYMYPKRLDFVAKIEHTYNGKMRRYNDK